MTNYSQYQLQKKMLRKQWGAKVVKETLWGDNEKDREQRNRDIYK